MLNSNILGVEVTPTQTSNTVPCDVCTLCEHDDCMKFINNKYICDDCMEKYNEVKSIDDDSKSVEMSALIAIQDAINHVHTLYTILLTDGMSCGKEYRDKVGLDDLLTIKEKLKKRILELDDSI